MQLDLAGHTANTLPPLRPEDGQGYLEIVEGANIDAASILVTTSGLGVTTVAFGGASVPNPANGTTIAYNETVNTGNIIGSANALMGDADDILALTVRSSGEPFVGVMNAGNNAVMAESQTAEVIWFALPNGRSIVTSDSTSPIQLYTLYRRVLLINPTYFNSNFGGAAGLSTKTTTTLQLGSTGLGSDGGAGSYDLSVYTPLTTKYATLASGGGAGVPNSLPNTLSTLTQRENRYYHYVPGVSSASTFPFPITQNTAASPSLANTVFSGSLGVGSRVGEDVVLTDVLAFDIRVFDPMAQVMVATSSTTDTVTPSDAGYTTAYTSGNTTLTYGAYVDMGYADLTKSAGTPLNPLASYFSAYPNAAYNLQATPMTGTIGNNGPGPNFTTAMNRLPQTYCTWSLGYDQNGYDDDNNGVTDQGLDGLDNDVAYGGTYSSAGAGTPYTTDGIVDDVPQITAPYLKSVSGGGTPTVVNGTIYSSERETLPPYPFPLRGVQIMIRVYEPDTRQVRQVTVVQDFLPD